MLVEWKLRDFVEAVGTKTPTPGGGSVSAAVGALGAALGLMAARFSEAPRVEQALEALKAELLALVDADAKAYGEVNAALALPRGTAEEKKRRKEAVQNALVDSSEVPLKGLGGCLRALRALADLAPRCNKNLVSDLAGATYFLEAAARGCAENVRINAASISEATRRERLEGERGRLLEEAADLRRRLLGDVEKIYVRE